MRVIIRPEQPLQYRSIAKINELAFVNERQARLVEELRSRPEYSPALSLVAQLDRQPVGHILLAPANLRLGQATLPVLWLATLAVLPEFQSMRIGSQLVQSALARCEALGFPLLFAGYASGFLTPFGFEPAENYAVSCPGCYLPLAVWCSNPTLLQSWRGGVLQPPLPQESYIL